MNKIYKNVFTIILFSISLNFWSCNSTVEYTSAKMALQNERWDEAETYLLEALKVEPENADCVLQSIKSNSDIKIEYLELRNKNNLSPIFNKKNLKLFVCFYIKNVRLIDNF